MKKTVIINISGMVFHIDEDAYEKLKGYLESLHHYFGNTSESKEIVSDIESRIAELLQPKISESKQSITIEDVDEILSILGSPEDIAGSDNAAYENEPASEPVSTGRRKTRRLYRDVDNSTIGGVCSGMGAYFDIDPIFFRILFVALVFAGGVSLFIYPILWIVLPAARTSAQKLEMRGKDVTLSNIEKTVRQELGHVKRNMDRPDSTWNRIGDFFREFFNFLGIFFRGIFSVLRYLLGAFLIVMAITFSIAAIGALYFKNFAFHGDFNDYFTSVQDFLYNIISPLNADTMLFLAFIILIIPIAGLVYLGLKLLIRFQAKEKWIIVVISVIWFLSVITFTIMVFNEADNFRSENDIREMVNLKPTNNQTIYVSTPALTEKDEDFVQFFSHSRLFFPLKNAEKEDFAGIVHIDVEKTTSATPELQIVKEARGEDRAEALQSARNVKVNYTQSDSLLTIDPFFRVPNDKRWKFYYTKVTIRLPIGSKIYFDETTRYLLDNIRNNDDYWEENMVNKTWIMTENGLELLGSNTSETTLLKDFGNKTLNLQLRDHYGVNREKLYWYNNGENYGNIRLNNRKYYYGTIAMDIRKSENDKINVELLRTSSGDNPGEAEHFSKAIEYAFEQNDSVLWLDPIFRFPENYRWNNQRLKVIVRLPINKKIYISNDFDPIMGDISSTDELGEWEYLDRILIMTNSGLVKTE
jgi:phage shock protein PspC (stress-responsive transcriptional regulator)